MKVFDQVIMRLNYFLLVLFGVFESVRLLPLAGTLEEKNLEMSWEAWLLVDDHQQQDPQVHDGEQTANRRIIPKSLFTVPLFSVENLPPCAEGYRSDPNGRCIKIIKLDEDKHLNFLLNKLNDQYGTSLDYDSMSEIGTTESAPTKFVIPLGFDVKDDYSNDTPDDEEGEDQAEVDMALIITPMRKETDRSKADDNSKLGKRDGDINEEALEEELRKVANKLPESTIKYDGITEDDDGDYSTTERTSTFAEEVPTTEEIVTSTTDNPITSDEASTTLETTTTTVDTTTTTTTVIPTTDTRTESQEATTTTTTTTPRITTYHPIATTYHPYFDFGLLGSPRLRNLVKFPQDESASVSRSRINGDYVRFPDADSKYQQQESLGPHTRDVDEQTGNFVNEIFTPQPSHLVQELVLPPKPDYFHSLQGSGGFRPKFFASRDDPGIFERFQTATTERHPPTKKQGAFLRQLAPMWAQEEHPKAIVLRSLPTDDLTYLFGYKNG